MPTVGYNERSWAIDVISEINLHLHNKSWHFKRAGGENTISNERSSLFPDVLIFKDGSKSVILQGWELKMPDTAINDAELIANAIKKAKILQRNSFVLWNVKSAVLYSKNGETYSIFKTWDDIGINTRKEVEQKEELWKALLYKILEDLNSYFESGQIAESVFEIFAIDTVIDVILENIPNTIENIKQATRSHSRIDALINTWWLSSASEYGCKVTSEKDKFLTLSKVILTDWVFKIVFAHILKRQFNEARLIEQIKDETTIESAKAIILRISEHCNFWNIFSNNLAQEYISQVAWKQLIQLNLFLSSININAIDIEILHKLLQTSIESAKRKVAGQFSTPQKLADLLTRLTIDNKSGVVLDPCCGTGTIINQAYKLKEEYEIPQDSILNSIWASDKHSFPIQLSTLTLTKPNNIGKIFNIFSSDVIALTTGQQIEFKDPNNGNIVIKELPVIDYVVSNLPFIKNEEIKVLNPEIKNINDWIKERTGQSNILSRKSDIFAYIPFYLYQLLSENGKIGLILSNAWMGTDYGEIFLELFQKFFNIEIVVISGKGKWFKNAEIVTTLLIANKKTQTNSGEEIISFCTLKKDISGVTNIKTLSENIILNSETEFLNIKQYSLHQIRQLEDIGMPWCSYFANLDWLPNVSDKLISCNSIFDFTRGERRGWNPLFYPAVGHNIESDYIKPILKDLRTTTSLFCIADSEAFSCSKSIEELQELHHTGAINWIRSFENQNNEKGIPLKQSLRKANMLWYEMKTDNMADFVANVNYDKSLFIAKFSARSFIDQRMIGFSIKASYQNENKILFLALFNSIISMFFIESFGFGRGLGALDLRATKFERDFKILDPSILSSEQKTRIIQTFEPITLRNRFPLEQELLQRDRINFENTLFEIYNISEYYESIKSSLLHLYRIRFAVKDE